MLHLLAACAAAVLAVPLLPVAFSLVHLLLREAVDRWRLRHIPGPRGELPLLGSGLEVVRHGLIATMERLIAAHGPVVKVRTPNRQVVIVADPDAARMVLTKSAVHAFPTNANANLMHPDLRSVDALGVVFQNGPKWRTLRNAWQTGFNPQSLPGYQPIMDRVALELVAKMAEGAADPDNSQQHNTGGDSAGAAAAASRPEVDIHMEVSKVALEIVGEAGFGVNLNGPEYGKSSYNHNGKPGFMSLMDALRLYFRTMTVEEGTVYAPIGFLTPPYLMQAARLLANAYPDKKLARHKETRRVLRITSERLLDAWRVQQEQPLLQAKASSTGGQPLLPPRGSIGGVPPLPPKGSVGGQPPLLQPNASIGGLTPVLEDRPSKMVTPQQLPPKSCTAGPPPLLQPIGSFGDEPPLLPAKGSRGGLTPVLETKVSTAGLPPVLEVKASTGAPRALQRNGSSMNRGTRVAGGGLLRSLSRALTRARSRLGRTRSGRMRGVAPGSFMGLMLEARDKVTKAGLTEDEVLSQAAVFMLAGYETTSTTMALIIYLLALHPEAAARVALEVDAVCPSLPPPGREHEAEPITTQHLEQLVYMQAVIEETMRLMPPAPYTTRIAEKNMQVMGYDVPAGTTLWIPMHHLHKKSTVWQDPEAFRPERFLPGADAEADGAPKNPYAFVPFGGGPRMCPGWRFAQQEIKTVLARLYQRYTVELAPGQQVPLPTIVGLTTAPANGLLVRLRPRF